MPALQAANSSGTLDTSFASPNGYLVNPEPTTARGIAVGAGNVVFAGGPSLTDQSVVAKFTANGVVDGTYGAAGYARAIVGDSSAINAVALRTGGKLLAAGKTTSTGFTQFLLMQFTTAGALDTAAFGSPNGYVVLSVPGAAVAQANALIIDGGGNSYVAGDATINEIPSFAIAKCDASGALVGGFGVSGVTTTPIGQLSSLNALAFASDGNILAAGDVTINDVTQFFIIKYNAATGLIDTTFGGGTGYVLLPITGSSRANAIGVDANGNILVGGATGNGPYQITVARLLPNGALDTTFNSPKGYISLPVGSSSSLQALLVDLQNGVIWGGYAETPETEFILGRFTARGKLDPLFGSSNGYTLTPIAASAIYALAFDSSKNILAGGSAENGSETAIARYFKVSPAALSGSTNVPNNINALIGLTGQDNEGTSLLTFSIVSGPTHGTLSTITQPTSTGTTQAASLFYTANNGYAGSDSFTFKVNNGVTDSATGTISIMVMNTTNLQAASSSTNPTFSSQKSTEGLVNKYYNRVKGSKEFNQWERE